MSLRGIPFYVLAVANVMLVVQYADGGIIGMLNIHIVQASLTYHFAPNFERLAGC